MTTILGIKTNSGPDAVVLVADTQINIYDINNKLIEKEYGQKLNVGRNWAMAYMGDVDAHIDSFYKFLSEGNPRFGLNSFLRAITGGRINLNFDLLDPRYEVPDKVRNSAREIANKSDDKLSQFEKIIKDSINGKNDSRTDFEEHIIEYVKAIIEPTLRPVEKAIKRKSFSEVALLNALTRGEDVNGSNEFLLATTPFGGDTLSLELYKVNCFGTLIPVKPRDDGLEFLCGGSGQGHIEKFFEHDFKQIFGLDQPIETDQITIPTAIFLADKAMKKASSDINTGEKYSMVIVTGKKIELIDITSKDQKSHDANLKEDIKKIEDIILSPPP